MRIKVILSILAVISLAFDMSQAPAPTAVTSYIVQGASLEVVTAAVIAVDGEITHELGIINAVAAVLTERERDRLTAHGDFRISVDAAVEVAGKPGGRNMVSSEAVTEKPALTPIDALHAEGITGNGVTVAVLDSGSMSHVSLNKNAKGYGRFLAQYNAISDEVVAQIDMRRLGGKRAGTGIISDDEAGHGTHVQSVIVSSATDADGSYNGVAPYAYLVSVKAFDANGQGTYADVIRGIDWIVANRDYLGIDILNLSLSTQPQSHYWDDPLNQAVMRAWNEGIVVVVSAGNGGPDPMTIGVPGNVPYVITVGAMSDNYTPGLNNDDILASFSAAGPTAEGFVKPEIVAPGGHIVGLMCNRSTIAIAPPQYHDGGAYFTMSGTSQSASVVSGIAALILEAEPNLTPDQVKCKLISSAQPAVDADGNLSYSVFQQGAGMVNAYNAVHGNNYDCANRGMDIGADLAGTVHSGGRANVDESGPIRTSGPMRTSGPTHTCGRMAVSALTVTSGLTAISGPMPTCGRTPTSGPTASSAPPPLRLCPSTTG